MTGALMPQPPGWVTQAACGGAEPSLFDGPTFVPNKRNRAAHRDGVRLDIVRARYCGTCPVAMECYSYGVHDKDADGIYGGQLVAYGRTYRPLPPPRQTPTRRGPRALQPCGTPAAYARHHRANEEPCQPCRAAHRNRPGARRPSSAVVTTCRP